MVKLICLEISLFNILTRVFFYYSIRISFIQLMCDEDATESTFEPYGEYFGHSTVHYVCISKTSTAIYRKVGMPCIFLSYSTFIPSLSVFTCKVRNKMSVLSLKTTKYLHRNAYQLFEYNCIHNSFCEVYIQ